MTGTANQGGEPRRPDGGASSKGTARHPSQRPVPIPHFPPLDAGVRRTGR
ncbi:MULTISPECIES: hypothetical protein [Microbacterium]